MRREKNVLFFKKLFDSDVVVRISDEQYKEDALRVTLEFRIHRTCIEFSRYDDSVNDSGRYN